MSGLADRFSTVAKAKISRLLDRAEDPGEILDYAYERQLEALQHVRRSIAEVVAAKKRAQGREAVLRGTANRLEAQAREAMGAGRHELTRAALERKHLIQGEVESLDGQIGELEDLQRKLVAAEQRLGVKVKAFRTQKEVIKARYSLAEAQVRITGAANGVGEEMADVGMATTRALEKIEHMKARAAAVEELEGTVTLEDVAASGPASAEIERQLEQVGVKAAVDKEFADLKAELANRGADAR